MVVFVDGSCPTCGNDDISNGFDPCDNDGNVTPWSDDNRTYRCAVCFEVGTDDV